MQLYKIASEYKLAFDKMSDDEELTPEIIEDSLVDVKDEFENKVINVSYGIKNMEAEALAIKNAEKEMAIRRRNLENQIQRIKDYLQSNMEKCAITEIKCPYFKIRIKKCPPSVQIFEDDAVPDEFMRIKETREPDKTKIKDHLKNHDVTFAILVQKNRLEIK
jgi:hypothetical protein